MENSAQFMRRHCNFSLFLKYFLSGAKPQKRGIEKKVMNLKRDFKNNDVFFWYLRESSKQLLSDGDSRIF